MMAALDGWGGAYTPLLFGCAVITVTGAACLLDREVPTVMLRLHAWWKDARLSRERQVRRSPFPLFTLAGDTYIVWDGGITRKKLMDVNGMARAVCGRRRWQRRICRY